MNDEATVHYNSVIDQMTWGHRRLTDEFGKCGVPRVAWQVTILTALAAKSQGDKVKNASSLKPKPLIRLPRLALDSINSVFRKFYPIFR